MVASALVVGGRSLALIHWQQSILDTRVAKLADKFSTENVIDLA
jgi:hypothetical protein